ncbi:MAG: biotin/lipoyl-containing protein, partial [Rudaea sp.]
MSETRTFRLPDLGEGLPDATIVEWLVNPGDTVRLDQPMISMETAKAVVEVPSPYSGKFVKAYGGNGDVIATGAALADFEIDASAPQRAEGHSTGQHAQAPAAPAAQAPDSRADTGTVVGEMQASDRVVSEAAVAVGGVRAVPAVRALARKLRLDLATIAPTGADGVVTMNDVKQAAARGAGSAAT